MTKKELTPFDYSQFEKEAIKKLRSGKGFTGEGGALTGLIGRILQAAYDEEMANPPSPTSLLKIRTSKSIGLTLHNVCLWSGTDKSTARYTQHSRP